MTNNNPPSLTLLFGGQGYIYLPDLRKSYHGQEHDPIIRRLIHSCLEALGQEEDHVDAMAAYATHVAPFKSGWVLDMDKPQPSQEFIHSAAISYPLIFVAQMARYCHARHVLHGHVVGATGHSQGIVAALVASLSHSDEELIEACITFVRYMFWQGLRCQQSHDFDSSEARTWQLTPDSSPMLAVSGISPQRLTEIVKATNKTLRELSDQRSKLGASEAAARARAESMHPIAALHMSLINSDTACVVSGRPLALQVLKATLDKASATNDQSRIPFSKRKAKIQTTFLSVSAPFHCTLNEEAVPAIMQDAHRCGMSQLLQTRIETNKAQFPVIGTAPTPSPMCLPLEPGSSDQCLELLIRMQATLMCDFSRALRNLVSCSAHFTHVFDFGPSGRDGLGGSAKMAAHFFHGSGRGVISCHVAATTVTTTTTSSTNSPTLPPTTTLDTTNTPPNLSILHLATEFLPPLPTPVNWQTTYSPTLVTLSSKSSSTMTMLCTKFTRTIGKPPIIMPGMTPTTSFNGIDLVAACNGAGFHGELAGGGLPLPDHFTNKVKELCRKQPPGTGITINMLYLNAYLWGFQFPLALELARAGYPIESVTIAAGVPTPEKARDIVSGLASVGIRYIALKPGTAQMIRDSLDIAHVCKEFGLFLCLQWTGGRGGGHHSYEDFHQPLLETYGEIRSHDNVLLVVGSGFGDAHDSLPYLTGEWSERLFARPRMPCDAILFGSRCMVAKEAATAEEVKRLIIQCPGVLTEQQWETSYDGDAGGVLTVTSELGEPIHKIHNRGMKCWREFDRKYFSVERGAKRALAIAKDKPEIIARLNADFQKVYFGRKASGQVADLEDMTYSEVLRRMVRLMYVDDSPQNLVKCRWVDVTYQSRTFLFLVRTERRFFRQQHHQCVATNVDELTIDPMRVITKFEQTYPDCMRVLLSDDDVAFFIDLCKDLRNGKPINFVPVIDGDLDYWFKKDSLWCSEDLDAVWDRDPGRVCILQGPVAVKYANECNEPIAKVLGDIHTGWIDELLTSTTGTAAAAAAEVVDSLSTLSPKNWFSQDMNKFDELGLEPHSWLRVVLCSPKMVRGNKIVASPVPNLFKQNDVIQVLKTDGITVGACTSHVVLKRAGDLITITLTDSLVNCNLSLTFLYVPSIVHAPLRELTVDNSTQIRAYYAGIWGGGKNVPNYSIRESHTNTCVLSLNDIVAFNKSIGRCDTFGVPVSSNASLDVCTVIGWSSLMRTLFSTELSKANLLRLVHLSHGYRIVDRTLPAVVNIGESFTCVVRGVSSVEHVAGSGSKISCAGMLYRGNRPWVEISTSFMIRGDGDDEGGDDGGELKLFRSHISPNEQIIKVLYEDEASCAVVMSKPWLISSEVLLPGDVLEFELSQVIESETSGCHVVGQAFLSRTDAPTRKLFGRVEYQSTTPDNPVLAYLRRSRLPHENGKMLESGGKTLLVTPYVFHAPRDSTEYAMASHDLNPIHRLPEFATLADLPGPIVHGMWTAAVARRVVEQYCKDPVTIASYQVDFVGMVRHGDGLAMQLYMDGVLGGKKLLRMEVRSLETGEAVLRGRCEVDQARTAYLFTGQGSASVGMGMDRYSEVDSVRKVWDLADAHLVRKYGFSILDIVRHNPKELTIHFGGPTGRVLRDNYRMIKVSDPSTGATVQLLPEISADTKSFTFKASAEGLLFATQFAQPALVIIQKAAFQELIDNGLVPADSFFAGHSLGEYAALASFAQVLSVEDLVETVFLRGMVMQNAVKRDHKGRSDFAMVAANPGRVGGGFDSKRLETMVDAISSTTGQLLQVVNYNIRENQYVVAGHLLALDALEICMTALSSSHTNNNNDDVHVIAVSVAKAKQRLDLCVLAGVPLELQRGTATIPLAGIDVPFHSRQLLQGVPAFRELLEPRLSEAIVSRVVNRLVGKYIPNVTAKLFALDRKYVEYAATKTGSVALADLCRRVDFDTLSDGYKARTLLVELLAHQFAMPVLWIDTQDLIFQSGTRRLVEMGPAPTLVGMAQRTWAAGVYGQEQAEILWFIRDMGQVTYSAMEDQGPPLDVFVGEWRGASGADVAMPPAAVAAVTVPPPPPPQPAPPPQQQQQPPTTTSLPDAPPSVKHTLRVLLCIKLKVRMNDIKDESTIKSLSQGKSAVQNEIVGDLQAEFGAVLNEASNLSDMPLNELASKIQSYKQLGKVSLALVNKTLGAKLPGEFPATLARSYLTTERGIPAGRVDSVLLQACTSAPAERLGNVQAAKKWLDDVLQEYAKEMGVSLQQQQATPPLAVMHSPVTHAPIPDAPVSAKHVLQVLLACKLKRPLQDVKDDSSIKSLSQGKSAVQNEIVGDLQAEFGAAATGLEPDTTVVDMGTKLGAAGYKTLGKITSGMVNKMMAAKLPGEFPASSAKTYLSERLPPGRVESVLLHALVVQPQHDRCTDVVQAKTWLDDVVKAYGTHVGLDLNATTTTTMSPASTHPQNFMTGGGGGGPSPRFDALVKTQIEALEAYLGLDSTRELATKVESEKKLRQDSEALMTVLKAELGDAFVDGVRPAHDPLRSREYDSYWNWVMQDAMELHYHVFAAVKRLKGESVSIPNADNAHFQAMAQWIASVASGQPGEPPQAWFRNFLCNRATSELLIAVEFFSQSMSRMGQVEYAQIISLLAEQVEAWVGKAPVFMARADHRAPHTNIGTDGKLSYVESPRQGVSDATEYVRDLAQGLVYPVTMDESVDVQHPQQSVVLEAVDVPLVLEEGAEHNHDIDTNDQSPPITSVPAGSPRSRRFEGPLLDKIRSTVVRSGIKGVLVEIPSVVPLVHVRSPLAEDRTQRVFDVALSKQYLACLHDLATRGISFEGQVALVTGAGIGSIGVELVKALLEGGATVISTINESGKDRASVDKTYAFYRRVYEEHGSKGSRLILETFNAASTQDTTSLITRIYTTLGLDLDFVIPFAAIPERGKDISNIDSHSELAHRAMLTNVIRLLGVIKDCKAKINSHTRPALVLLPCSPNHGVFGGDGLYAESKLGVEALMDKWKSEGWHDYLSVVACVIGWTRSALMWQNNIVAEGIETLGCRTFSTSEMAINLIGFLHPRLVTLAGTCPLWGDLTGGWIRVKDLDVQVKNIRQILNQRAARAKALHSSADSPKRNSTTSLAQSWVKRFNSPTSDVPLPNPAVFGRVPFPNLSSTVQAREKLQTMRDMVDLERIVVVVGYGEVGPWGNSRTRWEMEAYGEFSLEGCTELAFLMGLIKPHNGPLVSNPRVRHAGYVDAQTGEAVAESEMKRRYESVILQHCGVRIVEPELFDGYDPNHKKVWCKVAMDRDLLPVEVASLEQALEIQNACGGPTKCDVLQGDAGQVRIRLRAGAVLSVPRAFRFDRFIAGQIPTGWNAERLGIPPEIARAVDPVTLYALVSTMDAFCAAGVCDPYELYQYVHLSGVGNTSGGGMGGMRSLKRMFSDRLLDDDIPSDTLAESFINTMPAWVNMLLLSSAGPIKTPVGACATAAESVDVGVETILSGKARVVVCGGYDDFGEVGSYEFAKMGATNNSAKDQARGRRPDEATRPMTSSRDGFVESHGAGIQVLMDAALAIQMGCPIYGIVALTNTATDKEGRSIPAPGRGILSTARSSVQGPCKHPSLNLERRKRAIEKELKAVNQWFEDELIEIELNVNRITDESGVEVAQAVLQKETAMLHQFRRRKLKQVYETWGQGFWHGLSSEVSPLVGALAVWGLTVNDIGVVSCHGTSTTLNDKNESAVVDTQFKHMGRDRGNVVLVVAQKWITAHPKGAAAAWMLNGSLQILNSGLVPGNRNLDNCAQELRKFDLLFYPNRSIQLPKVEAVLLKSFGFGQAGAEILMIHPDRLLAVLNEQEFKSYVTRRDEREVKAFRYSQGIMSGKHKLVQVKSKPPYTDDLEEEVLLNPDARAEFDEEAKSWMFRRRGGKDADVVAALRGGNEGIKVAVTGVVVPPPVPPVVMADVVPAETRLRVAMQEQAEGLVRTFTSGSRGVGVDVEPLSTFADFAEPTRREFLERNFTTAELEYCFQAADPAASLAGRWAAKEAVVKALSSSASSDGKPLWAGPAGTLIGIEIVNSSSGAPVVVLRDHAKEVAVALGVSEIKVSISHAGQVAVAQALVM